MAISLLCSASFKALLLRPISESVRKPGCGLSQLSGVEYSPSRGGTSGGGGLSILERCSARFMDANPPSSSESALSRALSSRKSSDFKPAGLLALLGSPGLPERGGLQVDKMRSVSLFLLIPSAFLTYRECGIDCALVLPLGSGLLGGASTPSGMSASCSSLSNCNQ